MGNKQIKIIWGQLTRKLLKVDTCFTRLTKINTAEPQKSGGIVQAIYVCAKKAHPVNSKALSTQLDPQDADQKTIIRAYLENEDNKGKRMMPVIQNAYRSP